MPGAGTSASVFLQLHGSLADGPRARLRNDGEDNFRRGATDTFSLTALDLGEVTSATVWHDGATNFAGRFDAGWYLERVAVRAAGREWVLPCRRWLAADREDGRTRRTLYPAAAAAAVVYRVAVLTAAGGAAGGGCGGAAEVRLHGAAGGESGWLPLREPAVHDGLEPGMWDMFVVRYAPPRSLSLTHLPRFSVSGRNSPSPPSDLLPPRRPAALPLVPLTPRSCSSPPWFHPPSAISL